MLILLLKSSLVLFVLLGFYKLLLERESFFSVNRVYLLGCLFVAGVLPFLSLPKLINDQGLVDKYLTETITSMSQDKEVEPVLKMERVEVSTPQSSKETNQHLAPITTLPNPQIVSKKTDWIYWLLTLYYFGVVVLIINLIAQILNMLLKVAKCSDKVVDEECTIVNLDKEAEPCSFFRYIIINPQSYDYETYEQILAHEQIHVRMRHSFDLIITELAVVFLWFNPFVWIFRKEVEKNIEYQTDSILLNNKSMEAEAYQMNLLKVATYRKPLTVTTNYNQSLIKNRIIKMCSKKSNPHSLWKYTFVIPVLFGTLLLLNQPLLLAGYSIDTKPIVSTDINTSKLHLNSDAELKNKNFAKATDKSDATKLENSEEIKKEKVLEEKAKNKSERKPKEPQTKSVPPSSKNVTIKNVFTETKTNNGLPLNTTKLDIIKELALLGDNRAMNTLERLKNLEFSIMYADLEDLPDRTFTITIDNIELEERLEIMKMIEIYNKLPDDNKLEIYHIYDKYDLEKKYVLETLQGKLKLGDLEGDPQHKLREQTSYNYSSRITPKFIDKGGEEGLGHISSLMDAVIEQNEHRVIELLKTKNPNDTYPSNDSNFTLNGGPMLHVRNARTALEAAARSGNIAIAKVLLDAGADINGHGYNSDTPLIAAAMEGQFEMVKFLLDQGADMNLELKGAGKPVRNVYCTSLYHQICYRQVMDQEILIPKLVPGNGTALDAAVNYKHNAIAEYLKKKGAK